MTDPTNPRRIRSTRPPRTGSCTAADGGQPIGDRAGGRDTFVPADDVLARARRHHREQEAFRIALLKIRERGLQMKLTRVEQPADLSRLVFYFTAEGRVDFRELVKELASEFRTRIEMRQIGVRDEARMLSGYGSCGRQLCCSAWLLAFEPVSIKMAKLQDLTLNPAKLSGLCGRLKCCLRFELTDEKLLRKGRKSRGDGEAAGNGNADDVVPDEPATGS
jgi:cell fate regulator YaaT (PSP1 superfamily)